MGVADAVLEWVSSTVRTTRCILCCVNEGVHEVPMRGHFLNFEIKITASDCERISSGGKWCRVSNLWSL